MIATLPAARADLRSGVVAPGLLVVAVALWLAGLGHVDLATLGGWGLITALSVPTLLSYPVLALAAVAEISRPQRRTWVLVAVTGVAVLMIYGLQPAVEGVARLPVPWLHAGFANYIAQHGHVLPNYDVRFSWPGFFALVAMLSTGAGGQDPTALLNWAPPVFIALSAVAVRALSAAVLGGGRAGWIATWIFIACDWTEQDYFSPQALAYVLMLAALAITARYLVAPGIVEGGRVRWKDRTVPPYPARVRIAAQLVVLAICVAIAPTHQLTPYALVGALAVLALWRRLWPRWLPVLALVPPVVWFVLGGRAFWANYLGWITSPIGAVASTVGQGVTGRVAGDLGHEVVTTSRVALTCVVALLAGIGWLILRRRGHRTWTLPALALSPFGIAVLQPYGGEVFVRCYLYALPWFAIGAAVALTRLLDGRRAAARSDRLSGRQSAWRVGRAATAVALALLIGVTVFVRGGNDAYVGVTAADVNAVDYVYAHARDGDLAVALLWYEPLRSDRIADLEQGGLADPTGDATNTCDQQEMPADMLGCLARLRPRWVLVNPQQEKAGRILDGWPAGWMRPVVAGLLADGYRQVFDQDSSIVLHLPGASS